MQVGTAATTCEGAGAGAVAGAGVDAVAGAGADAVAAPKPQNPGLPNLEEYKFKYENHICQRLMFYLAQYAPLPYR